MKYSVTVAGKTFEVDVDGGIVDIDGRAVAANLEAIPGTPLRQLVLDGLSHTYAVSNDDAEWTVSSGGEVRTLYVEDERTKRLGEVAGGSGRDGGGGVVMAPMPGLVLRVEVEEGQRVETGAGVVVLEAMKMENEIKVAVTGRVTAVHVDAGQAVDKGMLLVEVTPEG